MQHKLICFIWYVKTPHAWKTTENTILAVAQLIWHFIRRWTLRQLRMQLLRYELVLLKSH